MREIEIEFKNLLTEDEYNNLFTSLKLEDKPQIINKNFYYDDANENLKKLIRHLEFAILIIKTK